MYRQCYRCGKIAKQISYDHNDNYAQFQCMDCFSLFIVSKLTLVIEESETDEKRIQSKDSSDGK